MRTNLVNGLSATRPPREAVKRAFEAEHQGSELARHARRTPSDRDLVADLERLALDALRAELRRARPLGPAHAHLLFGDLEVVPDEGKVNLAGQEVHLTKTEFRLLCELAQNPGRVFSREELLDKVWGYGYFGDGRLVDVHVRRLRTKVEADPANPRHVVTVRGLGYRLQS